MTVNPCVVIPHYDHATPLASTLSKLPPYDLPANATLIGALAAVPDPDAANGCTRRLDS